jgi:uncharacterized repeat protein (TIGR01451 family)
VRRQDEGEESQALGEGEEVDMSRRYASVPFALCALVLAALCVPGSAVAEVARPQWTVTAFSNPTNLAPGGKGIYRVYVQNTGGAPSDGEPVSVTDVLPEHLKAAGEATGLFYETHRYLSTEPLSCAGLTCTYSGVVGIDVIFQLEIPVEVVAGARETETNVVTVSGGGAPEVLRETPTVISVKPAGFGIAPGSFATALSSTQAGGHPDLTTVLAYTTVGEDRVVGNPREGGEVLPPGFVGDLADEPKCDLSGFSAETDGALHCSPSTIVGTVTLYIGAEPGQNQPNVLPLLNLSTNPGEIAKLGFSFIRYGIQATVSLIPGTYGVRTSFAKINDLAGAVHGISLTVWGVPSEHRHDLMRGLRCSEYGCSFYSTETEGGDSKGHNYLEGAPAEDLPLKFPEGQPVTTPPIPYLTSPTDCTVGPLQATLYANSWEEPAPTVGVASPLGPMTGCGLLEFAPAIAAAPDTASADTPAGFTFGVSMGQEGLLNSSVTSEADIENTTVTLPEGIAINPGQANGLGACQESQEELNAEAPPACPSDSKVGTVEIETPVLRDKLDGNVYVLQSNPPDLKLLVAPEDPPDGIYVKFVGDVHLNEATGQLVTTFERTPQLPFSKLKFNFSGGAQAALTTPTNCGTYTTSGVFTPWNGEANVFVNNSFAVESGTGGAACPTSPLPFTPRMIAGATTDQAGGYTHFSLLLQRVDDQQRISRLQFKTPEGLLGMIAKVPLCGEPQASTGDCPEASQIGHTVVEAGPGPYPLDVPQPGEPPAPIYLTGPYEGAPYGLDIVVPLHVGPFVLKTQVVRARIEVDPLTSQLTITTGTLPEFIDGVPADLRDIDAVIDRPEFMFNPTSCAPQSFSGTAYGFEGGQYPIESHFQMGSCRSLLFKPNFTVSTSGKTSRKDGASLDARIVYPVGNLGANQASSQSNIKRVRVELPKQLPSRLSTLQKACTERVFQENPADCPAASKIGQARAITPVLPVPLNGPAIFVSNGGAKFPELVVVLQGYGVTIDLHGETFISAAGITSSTFNNIPDVPIASFELYLPEGPDSALSANANLCKSKLVMPTEFVAQNAAVIQQNTKIAVAGCAKATKASKARRARNARRTRDAGNARRARKARTASSHGNGEGRGK